MGRRLVTGTALAIAALPVPALAQPGVFADCAVERADAGLRRSLAAALIGDADEATVDGLMTQFAALSKDCTAPWLLDDAQRKAYLDYGVMRLMRDWLASELSGYGLSAATVDEALDFGPDRRNAPLSGRMSEDEVKALVQAFIESGVDAENLSSPAWEAVGTYAAISPIFWRKQQQIAAWQLVPGASASAPVAASAAAPATAAPEPETAPAEATPETPAPVEPAPEAPTPAPESPPPGAATLEPVPEADPAEPIVAPEAGAVEAAPPETAPPEPAPEPAPQPDATPTDPAAPVTLPYEPLPDTVDPVLTGGEAPPPVEEPRVAPPGV